MFIPGDRVEYIAGPEYSVRERVGQKAKVIYSNEDETTVVFDFDKTSGVKDHECTVYTSNLKLVESNPYGEAIKKLKQHKVDLLDQAHEVDIAIQLLEKLNA